MRNEEGGGWGALMGRRQFAVKGYLLALFLRKGFSLVGISFPGVLILSPFADF